MEDFVTFEIAKKLKEKGFNIPSYFYYRTDDKFLHNAVVGKPLVYNDKIDDEVIIAPTNTQVLKWLRKEKNVHIKASVYQDESEDSDGRIVDKWCFWNWDIQSCISGNILQDGDDTQYESYEEASLAGIEYVINNLI